MEKKSRKKKDEIVVDKEFFLKVVDMVQKHEDVLQKMAGERENNLGFELGYIDEKDLDAAARYVRTQSFMREMKAVFTKYSISRLAGAFDLNNNRHEEEKEIIKKVVEGGS